MNLKYGLAIVFSAAFIFPITYSQAEIYKWVDENGKVHFGDKKKGRGKGNKAEVVELKRTNSSGGTPAHNPAAARRNSGKSLSDCLNADASNWLECQSQRMDAAYKEHERRSEQSRKAAAETMRSRTATARSAEPSNKEKALSECQEAKFLHHQLTSARRVGDQVTFNVYKEDGKVVSEKRNREKVKELKAKLASKKCANLK